MQIFVRSLNGKTITLDIDNKGGANKIKDIK